MTCSVIGLGKLGLCIAAVLARYYKVIGIDTDEKLLTLLASGTSPIKEKDLDVWLAGYGLDIAYTNEFEELGDIAFVVVPTPSIEDNTFTYLVEVLGKMNMWQGIAIAGVWIGVGLCGKFKNTPIAG